MYPMAYKTGAAIYLSGFHRGAGLELLEQFD